MEKKRSKKSSGKYSLVKVLKNQEALKKLERKELREIERLEKLEEKISKELGPHPLTKITYHDVTKASIGAFIGVVAHFAFIKGIEIAEEISFARATNLYLLSFLVGLAFLYLAGFRKVKQIRILNFLPLRIVVIYVTSILVALLVLIVFGVADLSFQMLYKQVAVISILAVLGATTADLIGRD